MRLKLGLVLLLYWMSSTKPYHFDLNLSCSWPVFMISLVHLHPSIMSPLIPAPPEKNPAHNNGRGANTLLASFLQILRLYYQTCINSNPAIGLCNCCQLFLICLVSYILFGNLLILSFFVIIPLIFWMI